MQQRTRQGAGGAATRFAITLGVATYLLLFAIVQVERSLTPEPAIPTAARPAAQAPAESGAPVGQPGTARTGQAARAVPAGAQPFVERAGSSDGPIALTRPVHLRIASWELGSAWYFLAAVLAKPIQAALPAGSTVDLLPYAGAVHNPEKLAAGEAEIALALHNTAGWAYEGKVVYDRARSGLRGLAGGLGPAYVVVAASQAAVHKHGLTSLRQAAAERLPLKVVTVPKGGGGEVIARLVLEAHGLDYAALERFGGGVTHTSLSVIPTLMRDGRADVFIHVAPPGHPTLSELGITAGLVFLPLDERAVAGLAERYGFLPTEIPAGTFPGQTEAVPTAGALTVLVAYETLDFAVAYRVTRAVLEAAPALSKAHPAVQAFQPETAWRPEVLGVPLHAGAEAYYRERGWFRPEALDPVLGAP